MMINNYNPILQNSPNGYYTTSTGSNNNTKESGEEFYQNREIDVLAKKINSAGFFTEDISKVIAESIIKGNINYLA